TSCPSLMNEVANTRPTTPEPMIPIFITNRFNDLLQFLLHYRFLQIVSQNLPVLFFANLPACFSNSQQPLFHFSEQNSFQQNFLPSPLVTRLVSFHPTPVHH